MASDNGIGDIAKTNSQNAGNVASTAVGTTSPIYTRLASGTVGLTPEQKANMLTSSAESLGGTNASVQGQGVLEAARTGNVGGADAAMAAAARTAQQQQRSTALDVENQDAQVARDNQRLGLGGLSSIYGTATGAQDANLKTAEDASNNAFWKKAMLASIQSAGQVGSAAVGA